MKLFVVVVFCICIIHGYPDKRPVITVEEVSSEETEIELDHPWTCGTDAFSLLIAEGTIDKDCPEVKNQVNNCCYAHDNCYDDQLGRDHCDDVFCECLQTATITNKLCHEDDAHVFCNLVRQLGESAYNASGHLNSTEIDTDDPLADLLGTAEALNQTTPEYYDYEKSEKTVVIHQQRTPRTSITKHLSNPTVITRFVKKRR